MASIIIRKMGGMAPSANAQALDPSVATLARNFTLRFGDYRPLRQPAQMSTANAGATLYRMETAGGFMTRIGEVNFVRGPIATDATERTYYTGDGVPKVTDLTNQVRQLGVPSPGAAPAVNVNQVAQYSTDDQVTAVAAKTVQFGSIVLDNLDHPYQGVSQAELGANYSVGSHPWLSSFNIYGSLVNGAFIPTNRAHATLMDDRLGFYLVQMPNGTIQGGIDITVRSMITSLNGNLSTALGAIKDPTDANKSLMTTGQISSAVSALNDALKPANANFVAGQAQLAAMMTEFTALANAGSTATAGQNVSIVAFYQRTDVQNQITNAINRAANAIRDAILTYK
jgi:hypothetical protein